MAYSAIAVGDWYRPDRHREDDQKNWKSGLAKGVQDAADAEALSGIPILLSIRHLSMSGAWINKKSPSFRTLPWIIAYRRPEHHHYLQAVGITVPPPHMEGPQELKTPAMGVHQEQSHSVTAEHEWLCTCNLTDAVRKLKAALQPEK